MHEPSLAKSLREIKEFEPFIDLVRAECPYQIPKGYIRWDLLSGVVGLMLRAFNDRDVQRLVDQASLLNAYRTALWFVQNAPLYCISNELLRSFEETDIAEHSAILAELEPPIHTAIILFPCNSVIDPCGDSVDYAVFHLADRDHPEYSTGERAGFRVNNLLTEYYRHFTWSSVSSKQTAWFSGTGVNRDGTLSTSDAILGKDAMNTEDIKFTNRIKSILFQCLLALTYEPELIEAGTAPIVTTPAQKGFAKT